MARAWAAKASLFAWSDRIERDVTCALLDSALGRSLTLACSAAHPSPVRAQSEDEGKGNRGREKEGGDLVSTRRFASNGHGRDRDRTQSPPLLFISFASAMKSEVGYVAEGEKESLLATFLVRRKMAGKK